jgi:CheY-like chemotaxis protein
MTSDTSDSILLIEDNHGDVMLFQTALEGMTTDIVLRVARNVDEGIGLLTGTGNAGVPLQPNVILLDLHMPGKDGMSFLRYRHENREFAAIPVIVLSSSTRRKDVDGCMQLGVLRYQTKPMGWPEYQTLIADLRPFWDRNFKSVPCNDHPR